MIKLFWRFNEEEDSIFLLGICTVPPWYWPDSALHAGCSWPRIPRSTASALWDASPWLPPKCLLSHLFLNLKRHWVFSSILLISHSHLKNIILGPIFITFEIQTKPYISSKYKHINIRTNSALFSNSCNKFHLWYTAFHKITFSHHH